MFRSWRAGRNALFEKQMHVTGTKAKVGKLIYSLSTEGIGKVKLVTSERWVGNQRVQAWRMERLS